MARKRFVGPTIAFAAVLILASGAYLKIRDSGDDDSENAPEGDRPEVSATENFNTSIAIPVAGAPVIRDTLVISVTAAGEAAPWRESKVLARVEGDVVRLAVGENQVVGSGRTLIALDTIDLALSVREAEAQLAQAEAAFRETTLFDDQIEDPAVREERARVARAKSGLDQAEVNLNRKQLDLARTRVSSPFGGRVADIQVSLGHHVRAGDELMTVVDIDPIKVEVQVLEREVGLLEQGGQAQVTFAAFPGETFNGNITTINPIVDRESRTARVTVTIPNGEGRILPGMYADVALEAQRFPDRILVPKSAVLERDRRTMLFVYEGDDSGGLAKWNYVTLGLENDSLIEIVDNPDTQMLTPGQMVLIDGHHTLIHDGRVRLVADVSREEGGRPQ
ncbi:MAG: efflux RND transporter periplasmic adaptor subunit [Gemmatimonadota bacterium]|nr:efflux RND transporter periplasmic adaptor subunit [Gemmatimonadota bacterium]